MASAVGFESSGCYLRQFALIFDASHNAKVSLLVEIDGWMPVCLDGWMGVWVYVADCVQYCSISSLKVIF